MLNQIVLMGNLGGDPETHYSSEKGEPIVTFNLAFKLPKKNGTGWIKVTSFGRLAETCEKYLHKGARIAVIGVLHQHKWQADDGSNRSSFEVLANTVEFVRVDGRAEEEQGQEAAVAARGKEVA